MEVGPHPIHMLSRANMCLFGVEWVKTAGLNAHYELSCNLYGRAETTLKRAYSFGTKLLFREKCTWSQSNDLFRILFAFTSWLKGAFDMI